MKRNTYVTAALFVVFGLLTAIYWNMPDRTAADYDDPALTGAINHIHPGDLATMSDVDSGDVDEECCEESDAMADASSNEDADDAEDADADANVSATDENSDENDEDCCEVISLLDSLRTTMENERTAQVNALTEIMASAEFSAQTKSAAKDSLNDLNALAHSSRMLETVIGHQGFEDVLVRATADFVHVTVQVSSLDDVPTLEQLAELYILAGIQFGAQRNGNISIDFQPLN